MVAWIARGLLIAGGGVTSWFVAKDAPNFGLVQMARSVSYCLRLWCP
jgi:hypothetical protein